MPQINSTFATNFIPSAPSAGYQKPPRKKNLLHLTAPNTAHCMSQKEGEGWGIKHIPEKCTRHHNNCSPSCGTGETGGTATTAATAESSTIFFPPFAVGCPRRRLLPFIAGTPPAGVEIRMSSCLTFCKPPAGVELIPIGLTNGIMAASAE